MKRHLTYLMLGVLGFTLVQARVYVGMNVIPWQDNGPQIDVSLSHFHPDVFVPDRLNFIMTPLYPGGYERGKDTDVIKKILIKGMKGESKIRSFPNDSAVLKLEMLNKPTTVTLKGEDGTPNRQTPAFLDIEHPAYGRMRYTADLKDSQGFGTLIEWEKLDGEVVTMKSMGYEVLRTKDGSRRQFRTLESLAQVHLREDRGIEWTSYRKDDVLEEKDADGLYRIREGAIPFDHIIFLYPEPPSWEVLRHIHRRNGRTWGIYEYRLRSTVPYPSHTLARDLPKSEFSRLDPEGTPDHKKQPVDSWWKKQQDSPEIAKRYQRATGQDYIDFLRNRALQLNQPEASIVYNCEVPKDSPLYGKDRLRVSDGSFSDWQVLFYDERGRLRAEYRPAPGQLEAIPSIDEHRLKETADRIEVQYSPGGPEGSPSVITHWIKGAFISRTWITEGKDNTGTEALLLEQSENPEAEKGNARNRKETRSFLWPGILF